MNNVIKKSTLTLAMLTGMVVSASANAAPSHAVVVWSGTVPTIHAGDDLVITGFGGDLTALNGTITPSTTGVFESDFIILEAHSNTGSVEQPVVGDLVSANWTLMDVSVTYDGVANPAQVTEVNLNGAVVAIGDEVSSVETVTAKVSQTADLPEAEVGGTTVQASMTIMADIV